MILKLSVEQLNLARLLNANGKKCYISGGAIRDAVMGIQPRDIDFNTDAIPSEMIRIFHKNGWRIIPDIVQKLADDGRYEEAGNTKGFGVEFGMIQVRAPYGTEFYEVTTFRSEQEYEGRKPVRMTFEKTVLKDLARRDLTMNSIAYDPLTDEIVDPYHGIADIKAGILRTVGNPVDRLREDPLRMLRVARFVSRFRFDIDKELSRAMRNNADYILEVSQEKFSKELLKMMEQSKTPSIGIEILMNHGLMQYIIPELVETKNIPQPWKFHKYDVYNHSLSAMDYISDDFPFLRLVALLHDIAKPQIYHQNEEAILQDIENQEKTFPWFKEHEKLGSEMVITILKRLAFSKEDRNRASHLVLHHMKIGSYRVAMDNRNPRGKIRKFIRKITKDGQLDESILGDLFMLNKADVYGSGTHHKNKSFELIDEFELMVVDELTSVEGVPIKLPVNGHDIMKELNLEPSSLIAEIKEFLTNRYLDDLSLSAHYLLGLAKRELDTEGSRLWTMYIQDSGRRMTE